MATVGSVSVEIVPDARGFPEKLRAQLKSLGDLKVKIRPDDGFAKDFETKTAPGMRAAGDRFGREVSGRLSAALKNLPAAKITADSTSAQRSIDQIRRQLETVGKTFGVHVTDKAALAAIDHLKGKLDVLARESPDIRVKVDAKAALAEIAALQGELGLVGDAAKKPQNDLKLLSTAVITLGPALIPIAGAAVATGAALGALGVTGVTAFLGVKKEMLKGTQVGVQYRAGLQTLKGDFSTLEATASKATLGGFQTSVGTLHRDLPLVNRDMGIFGKQLGEIAGNTVTGLVSGFGNFDTLLIHIGQRADITSGKFKTWASGPSGAQFAQSLGREFDQVVPVLADLATTVGHVVAAFAPISGQVLGTIDNLSKAINLIPLPVLKTLASLFVTFRTAKLVSGIFDNVGVSLSKMGKEGALANSRLSGVATTVGGLAGKAGLIIGTSIALNGLAKEIGHSLAANDSLNASLDNSGNAYSSFYSAVVTSNGAVDAGVKSAVTYQLQQDKLTGKAAKAGISQDQLTAAVTGTQQQYDALIATWKASGKPADDTIKAIRNLRTQYGNAYGPAADFAFTQKYLATLQQKTWAALKTTADSVTQVGTKYKLGADQVQAYAQMVGISKDVIDSGTISNAELDAAVKAVAASYNTATMAGSAFLSALSTFSQSAGTAADRAALIGATLRAASGDSLGYAGTLNSAAVAQKTFGDNIKAAAAQTGKGGVSTRAYLDSVVNLKTGVIDYNNAAAAPLITGLQSIQDAQIAAAQATYQHEVATKGGTVAGADAYNQYVARTGPQLVDQLTKLGLNSTAAHKLAKEYLGVPADVKTKIAQEGGGPVLSVLTSIKGLLQAIAGTKVHPAISIKDNASTQIEKIRENIAALKDHTIDITTYVKNVILPTVNQGGPDETVHKPHAAGGGVDDGWFTVGEGSANTWELGHKQGTDVQIFSNAQSKKMAPGGPYGPMPGYAGGTLNGIQYTTDTALRNAQARAAASTTKSDKALVVRFDRTDLTRFEKALKGGAQ